MPEYKVMLGKKRLFRESFRSRIEAKTAIFDAVKGATVDQDLRALRRYGKARIVKERKRR